MYIYRLLTYSGTFSRAGLLNVLSFIIALLFALVLHEVAHGLVALWNGDDTAKLLGRLSLNPLKHFDIIGLLMMLLCGFGWAKPVPVNPTKFKNGTKGMLLVSIAGVVTNILLAFVFVLFYLLVSKNSVQSVYIVYASGGNGADCTTKDYLMYFLYFTSRFVVELNVSFALFNILPLYPLDGYRVLSCFVSQENAFMKFLRKYSLYIMIGLMLIGNISVLSAYSPLTIYISNCSEWIIGIFEKFWGLIV